MNADGTARKNTRTEHSLLSSSTILILSAYLLGSAAGGSASPALQLCLHAAGATGLVAWIAFQWRSRRQAQLAEEKLQQTIRDLEIRIDRHVPRFRPARRAPRRRHQHDAFRQYLAVNTSNRRHASARRPFRTR